MVNQNPIFLIFLIYIIFVNTLWMMVTYKISFVVNSLWDILIFSFSTPISVYLGESYRIAILIEIGFLVLLFISNLDYFPKVPRRWVQEFLGHQRNKDWLPFC